jgi:hypothetical protein
MKKILLTLLVVCSLASSQAQNIYNYGFSGVTADMTTAGWTRNNQSTLASTTALWSVASYTATTATATAQNPFNAAPVAVGAASPIPVGQAGGNNSFALVNFNSTTSTATSGATISNWLVSPIITVNNGDIVTFYTRIGKNTTANNASYADRLQLRMSTNGSFTTEPSTGPTDVADYSTLLVDVNPLQNLTSYPSTWTQYSYTVTGLTGATDCKFAFRYFVTNGGANGSNSDIIGIDTFSVDAPAACAAPTAVTASAVTTTSATIAWTAPTAAPANGYQYYVSTTNTAPTGTTVATGTTAAGVVTTNLSMLTTGSTYYVWVRSVCSGTSYSAWSANPATFSTTAAPNCGTLTAPANMATNVAITYINNATTATTRQNRVALSWTAPTTGGTPTGYNIYWGASATTLTLLNTTPFVGVAVNITGVTHNTTYFWKIVPVNAGGEATGCVSQSFTTGPVPVGCMAGSLWPAATYTPTTCDGTTENIINADAWSSEYSNVTVTAGQNYEFNSSVATDFLSISTDAGVTAAAGGITPLLWTATVAGTIRFYIHSDANCGTQGTPQTDRTRSVYCGAGLATASFDVTALNVYPSRVKDILNVSFDKNISSIAIYNILGQEVIAKNVNANESKIDMSNLTSGTYLVKVTSDNQVKTIKVVKE